ncbi:MAG TPA: IS110 family transposase [Candidatus Micrarchaeaceae archaeon]|nr:IS110 family transposase [Candidatus Micrarchaeaceae archaeon]
MEVVHEKCAGLDVHKKTVVACVITPGHKEVRTFGTMTRELMGLADWLSSLGVTHVAMESTGVYWRSIFNLLEGNDFELLVANPRYMRAVPGRKTDVKDAEWIADLLRHGLLRASFVPDKSQRELRELVRYRKVIGQERARMVVRIEKVLEGANIKLTSVASHVLSMSSRAMLDELIAGNQDTEAMAELARSNMRSKRAQLKEALVGNVGNHQKFMLESHLRLIDQLDAEIASLSDQIEERMRPFQVQLDLIDQIPGIGRRGAEQIIAEIGVDMSRFRSPAHLASWARLCPGMNESGGKRRNASIGGGNLWVRSTLVEVALASVRSGRRKPNFFSARYHRLAARRGGKRAAIAVAHSILLAIYRMLKDGTLFVDLGPTHLDEKRRQAIALRSVKRLEELGFKVTIEEPAA